MCLVGLIGVKTTHPQKGKISETVHTVTWSSYQRGACVDKSTLLGEHVIEGGKEEYNYFY